MPTRREINELYAAANSLTLVTKERDELRAELATAKARMTELRKAVAEIIGTDPATWPIHGNASLAIAANIALMRAELDAIKQQNPAAWREFDGEGGYIYYDFAGNENRKAEWDERYRNSPQYLRGWLEPLYTVPGAQP